MSSAYACMFTLLIPKIQPLLKPENLLKMLSMLNQIKNAIK